MEERKTFSMQIPRPENQNRMRLNLAAITKMANKLGLEGWIIEEVGMEDSPLGTTAQIQMNAMKPVERIGKN